jgi:hypothetical protein
MKASILALSLAFSMLFICSTDVSAAESESPDKILAEVIKAYEKIDDYTCRFNRKELVDGKIKELLEEIIFEDIWIGAGLKDKDFDTKNPDCNF